MERLKILFLDDDKTRHERFEVANRKLGQHYITHVQTAEEAIKALDTTTFDEVCLDHDLGGGLSQMTTPEVGCGSGYDVACHIANMSKDKRPPIVVIHSFNPSGVLRMTLALKQAAEEGMTLLRVPFPY